MDEKPETRTRLAVDVYEEECQNDFDCGEQKSVLRMTVVKHVLCCYANPGSKINKVICPQSIMEKFCKVGCVLLYLTIDKRKRKLNMIFFLGSHPRYASSA